MFALTNRIKEVKIGANLKIAYLELHEYPLSKIKILWKYAMEQLVVRKAMN